VTHDPTHPAPAPAAQTPHEARHCAGFVLVGGNRQLLHRLRRPDSALHMSCPTGKQPLDYERAQKLARKSSASHSHPMTAYKCTACGWWHLGQPAKKPKRLPVVRKNNHQVRFA